MRPILRSATFEANKPQTWSDVAAGDGITINSFDELQTAIARVGYYHARWDIFLRGQRTDYHDHVENRTTILPSIYRSPKAPPRAGTVASAGPKTMRMRRWNLDHYRDAIRQSRQAISGLNALKQHDVAVWALLQHYQICPTPIVDVTRSARVAASFALGRPFDEFSYIYVFGLPYPTDNISMNYGLAPI